MKSMSRDLSQFLLRPAIVCLLSGFLLGQMTLAMAARNEQGNAALGYALVFLISAAASLTLFLKHRHAERLSAQVAAPVHLWLLILCGGVMASMYLPLLA